MVVVSGPQCPDLQAFSHLLNAIKSVQVSSLQSQVYLKAGEGDLASTNNPAT